MHHKKSGSCQMLRESRVAGREITNFGADEVLVAATRR